MNSDKSQAKEQVKLLVDKYQKVAEAGKIETYNEEMTKKDFILPLFKILGWDVENSDEVTAEEKVSKKRVDYGFRIDDIPKFFLEAKSLKEDLENPTFIEQAINYAWHKGCVWAVLTDFEDIKVFNAEWKSSNPLQNLFFSIHCSDFLGRFDQLWLLSKESFDSLLIDNEAEKWGKKAKKTPVDKQLLNDLTRFRELLTKNVLKNNTSKNLTGDDLDEIVQRIIDRLIFIRTLEDRQLEPPILQSLIRDEVSKRLFKRLNDVFRTIDEGYNSKLFANHLCDEVAIDDDVLAIIISGLFKTSDSTVHYDFGVIDADVLGNIYEQYLGHVLKRTEKRAKLSQGIAHRKEQGIYYTPIFVVKYIILNTVGELLKTRKNRLENFRVLDPTCGSGSFLIKAFDVIDDYYFKNDKDYHQTKFYSSESTPFGTKLQILQNNIFGVDLDEKAVEIAQLNLLLKVAEKRHRLPILQGNIKCGNSLIEDGQIAGNKAFVWSKEFNNILLAGGFDVIIGNPPYVHQKGSKDNPLISYVERDYYREHYESILEQGGKTRGGVKINLFIPYVERCLKLLKDGGRLGFIVHKNILKVESYKFLRRFILKTCTIEKIVDLGAGVFKDVTGETIIMILRRESDPKVRANHTISVIYGISCEHDLLNAHCAVNKLKQKLFENSVDNMFTIYMNPELMSIKTKIELGSVKLDEAVRIVSFGLNTSDNKKYISDQKNNDFYKKAVMGRDIERWLIRNRNKYVYYHKSVLTREGDEKVFLCQEKLIMQRVGAGLIVAYDNEQYYCFNSTNMILSKSKEFNLKYILALLNSELLDIYYRLAFGIKSGLTVNVTQGYLSQLPIKKATQIQQQEIVYLVDKILNNKRRVWELINKSTDERARLEEEILKLTSEIDHKVNILYGITKDEQKIIKDSLK